MNRSISLAIIACTITACQPKMDTTRPLNAKEQTALTQAVIPAMTRAFSLNGMSEIAGASSVTAEPLKTVSSPINKSEVSALLCEQQICANTQNMRELLDADTAQSENIELTKKISPLIDLTYKTQSESFKNSTLPLLAGMLKSKPQIHDEAKDFVYLNYIMALFNRAAEYIGADVTTSVYTFNYDLYIKSRSMDAFQISKSDAEVINTILGSDSINLVMRGTSFDTLIKLTLKEKPEYGSIQNVAYLLGLKIDSAQNEMYRRLKMPKVTSSSLKKALAKQDLSETDMRNLMQDYMMSDLTEMTISGSLQGIAGRTHFFDSTTFRGLSALPIERLTQTFQGRLEKQHEFCTLNVAKSFVLAPTLSQQVELKKNAELAKSLAQSEVIATVSDSKVLTEALSSIKDTTFKYPETKIEISKALSHFLNYEIERERSKKSAESQWVNFIQLSTVAAFYAGPQSVDAEIANTCGRFVQNAGSDSAIKVLNSINLSPTSAQDSRVGFGIIAHEFGHIVSAALRGRDGGAKKWEFPLLDRKVVSDFTCILNRLDYDGKKDDKLLEESYADSFSTRLVKRLRKPEYLTNIGCFLERNFGNAKLELVNSDINDTHPANFFRALTIHQDLYGQLPNVCSNYLENQGFKNFVMCQAH